MEEISNNDTTTDECQELKNIKHKYKFTKI